MFINNMLHCCYLVFEPRRSSSTNSTPKTALIIGIVIPIGVIALLSMGACWFIQKRKKSRAAEDGMTFFFVFQK